jgi:hypothetical protein
VDFATNSWSANHSVSIASGALLDINAGVRALTFNGSITGSGVLGIGMGTYNAGNPVIISVDQSGFTGTYIVSRVLRANEGVGLSSNANLLLALNGTDGAGILETSADFTRSLGTGAGQVRIGAMSGYWGGGFAAVGGPVTVSLGGIGTPQTLHLGRWRIHVGI